MALTTSLTAYYTFDSDNSNDSTANAYNGTDTSMTYGSSYGKISHGANFSGSGFISLPSGAYSVFNGTSSWTINAWVSLASLTASGGNAQTVLSVSTANTSHFNNETRLYYDGASWNLQRGDGTTQDIATYTTTPSLNTYYMVTGVYDGSNLFLYINGSYIGTKTASTRNAGTMAIGYFGQEVGYGFKLAGNMDEIGIWSRALSNTEISNLYNGSAGLQYAFTIPSGIAIDNSAIGENVSGSSASFSYTCSGTNRLLVVACTQRGGSSFKVTGVTYNGVSLTQLGTTQNQETTQTQFNMWYLLNPASGSNTMVITSDGAQNPMDYAIASYTGVKQTGFPDASTQNSASTGASFTGTVTTTADKCWTVMGMGGLGRVWTVSSGPALMRCTDSARIVGLADSDSAITPAGSTSIAINQATSGFYLYGMASFAPAVTANSDFLSFF